MWRRDVAKQIRLFRKTEAQYFSRRDWTPDSTLIPLTKFDFPTSEFADQLIAPPDLLGVVSTPRIGHPVRALPSYMKVISFGPGI